MLSKSVILPLIVSTVILTISKVILDLIYNESKQIIDEEFHLPEGLKYCQLNWTEYNPKITTPPGLYIVSALLLAPLQLCTVYNLRLVNVLAGAINYILIYLILKSKHQKDGSIQLNITALNVALLPPIYFFNFLYYTDVISLTFVLMMLLNFNKERHLFAALFGLASIFMRQTNVVWVMMFGGMYLFREYFFYCNLNSKKSSKKVKSIKEAEKIITKSDIKMLFASPQRGLRNIAKIPINVWLNFLIYVLVVLSFIGFVVINKGVVLGDKSAHEMTIHLPQIFYFSLFFLIFNWPHCLASIKDFQKFVFKNKCLTLFILAIFLFVVNVNTLEHPYLLADNRHYTFYVWNRFYRKFFIFKYAAVLIYFLSIFTIVNNLFRQTDLSCLIFYLPAVVISFVLQQMIEVRYFFIPYVLIRLNLKNLSTKTLMLEMITCIMINIITLKVFFDKDIYWKDYPDKQKLIW